METPGPSQRSVQQPVQPSWQRSAAGRGGAIRAVWLLAGALGLTLLAGLLVLPWMWVALYRALDAGAAPVAAPPPELAVAPPPRPAPVVVAVSDADAKANAEAAPPDDRPIEPPDDPGPGQLQREPERVVSEEEERNAPYVPQEVPYTGPTGMELFPPVGSKPLRSGLVVPEDFELPEGFVRHHQVTDDGEALPPILVFHPDYEHYDAEGNPIDTSGDRVVPPELAPEGLPIERLELPAEEPPGG